MMPGMISAWEPVACWSVLRASVTSLKDMLLLPVKFAIMPVALKRSISSNKGWCNAFSMACCTLFGPLPVPIAINAPPPRVTPPLRLTVEAGRALAADQHAALGERIAQRMHALLSVRPKITMVPHGSLPRSSQKTQIIRIARPDGPSDGPTAAHRPGATT